jgi:hypothetical protein
MAAAVVTVMADGMDTVPVMATWTTVEPVVVVVVVPVAVMEKVHLT